MMDRGLGGRVGGRMIQWIVGWVDDEWLDG